MKVKVFIENITHKHSIMQQPLSSKRRQNIGERFGQIMFMKKVLAS